MRLELTDFNKTQVHYLDEQYQTGIYPQHLDQFMNLFGGHPYLTHEALYTLATQNLAWTELVNISTIDSGPFAPHLRHYLNWLLKQPTLGKAMKDIILYQTCPDNLLFMRLLRAGLVKGNYQTCMCRCELYQRYLENKL